MDWFKIFPAAYLNVIKRIPDGVHRAAFALLVFHCWADGSLPDSDDDISYDTGLPVEIIAQLRPHLKRLARSEDGRLFINIVEETIRERKEFSEKKAQAGKAGGTQKEANKRIVKQVLAKPSSANQRQPVISTPQLRLAEPTHSYMHELTHEKQVRESMQPENPLSHPLSSALLDGAGFSEMQRESLSSMQYAKLGAAVTRLTAANITVAQVQAARKTWWASSPPNFDQLADEALKVASGKSVVVVNSKTHYQDGREKPEHLKGFVC